MCELQKAMVNQGSVSQRRLSYFLMGLTVHIRIASCVYNCSVICIMNMVSRLIIVFIAAFMNGDDCLRCIIVVAACDWKYA